MPVDSGQRFTRQHPCPICGGYDQAERGSGSRCYGYQSDDGVYANCTREEHAGGLPQHEDDTYGHKLTGDCHCGERHDPQPASSNETGREIVATYDYTDEDGNLLFQVVKYHPKDFRQRQPDGNDSWMWNLQNVRRVLYRLPELVAADPKQPVFIAEGEKDVDRLRELGLVATTNPMGAKKWSPEYSGCLEGRHVVCIQDNDGDGREHVEKVARALHGVAKSVRVLELPGLTEKGADVSDWLDTGHSGEELVDLARGTKEWEPAAEERPDTQAPTRVLQFQSAAEIAKETPEQPDWVIKPWVPLESIVEVDGKIKVAGKTTLLMAMSRKVLDGLLFMGEPTMKTPIVYLTEQPRSSLREALRRADLLDREDFRVLRYQDTIGTSWQEVMKAAALECQRVAAKLMVVDTLPQFAGLRGDSENSSGAALEALEPVQAVAAMGIGVIVSRHDGKADREVGDSGRGSSAWGGVADIIISIRRGEGNSSPTIRVLHSLSRFDETPDKLVIDLQDGEYVAIGTETQVALQQAKEAIVQTAPNSEEEAQKQKDLLKDAEIKHTTGVKAIDELVQEEQLHRIGQGKKGDAYRYWAPQFIQSEPPVVATQLISLSNAGQEGEDDEFIQSPIGVGVATQSIGVSPDPVGENGEGLGFPAEMHSVATPTLYTTESINDGESDDLDEGWGGERDIDRHGDGGDRHGDELADVDNHAVRVINNDVLELD